MEVATRCVALMAALPHPGRLFAARERPIARRQLDRRLRELAPADARTLDAVEGLLRRRAADVGAGDGDVAVRGRAVLAELSDATLLEVVRRRLEMRTVIAALRRRRDGGAAPADPGCHRRAGRLRRCWAWPDLGLGGWHPWLGAARAALDAGDALGLERLLLRRAWRDLDELGRDHRFDVTAVVLYVLRWDLMDRWMRYDAEAAGERLDALAAAASAAYGPVVPEAADG